MKNEKVGFAKTFSIWFGIGALMFGTYCGANMASGVYASAYITTFGGGWALVWILMFCAFMSFFCCIGINFVRAYRVSNYNDYYLALYGLHKPGSNAILRRIVSIFFDIFTLLMGLTTVASTIALFAELMNSLFNIPILAASAVAVLLFASLTIYGPGFLRKFNTLMTISLLVSLLTILAAVVSLRGDVLVSRIGNFNEGLDWSGTTLKAHFTMFLSFCFTTSQWGASLSNYSERIRTQKDAIGSGIMVGIMVTTLFIMTGAIVLPFMPEVMSGTPILAICKDYLNSPILTGVYWLVVILAVVSTAPTFTYNVSNRYSIVWKTKKLSTRIKFFILSLTFLLACWLLSGVGLMVIVQKAYTMLGDVALWSIAIPLLISIVRVWRKDRADKKAAE